MAGAPKATNPFVETLTKSYEMPKNGTENGSATATVPSSVPVKLSVVGAPGTSPCGASSVLR
jgi:hypothetical protein